MSFRLVSDWFLRPRRTFALALNLIVWLSEPFVVAMYYERQLGRNAYPPDADSIMIPIAEFSMGWLRLAPLVLFVLILAFWRSPRIAPLLGWDPARRVYGGVWTVLVAVLVALHLFDVMTFAADTHWLDAVHALSAAYALLALRAFAVAPRVQGIGREVGAATGRVIDSAATAGPQVPPTASK